MNLIDPHPVHVRQGFNVCIARQEFRLEAPHLAGRSGMSRNGLAADNPPNGGITSETLGGVHVFITARAPNTD